MAGKDGEGRGRCERACEGVRRDERGEKVRVFQI
jgi:hypothetical protein